MHISTFSILIFWSWTISIAFSLFSSFVFPSCVYADSGDDDDVVEGVDISYSVSVVSATIELIDSTVAQQDTEPAQQ